MITHYIHLQLEYNELINIRKNVKIKNYENWNHLKLNACRSSCVRGRYAMKRVIEEGSTKGRGATKETLR